MNRCYGLSGAHIFKPPNPAEGQATGRIVKAAEDHMRTMPPNIPAFTHLGPADWLLRQGIGAEYPGMEDALNRLQTLFDRLNKTLAEHLRALTDK